MVNVILENDDDDRLLIEAATELEPTDIKDELATEERLELKFCVLELELDVSAALETEERLLDPILETELFLLEELLEALLTESATELRLDEFNDELDNAVCELALEAEDAIALLTDAAIELELLTFEEELAVDSTEEALFATEVAAELELVGTTITSSIDEFDELILIDDDATLATDDED